MSDDHQLSTSAELRDLRDSLSGVATPDRPRLETIMARGRRHRRQRRSTVVRVSVVGAVAVTALGIGLTSLHGGAPARVTNPASATGNGSFTLISNTDGTVRLTLNPRELLDPAALESDLAKHGIPARVTTGSFCTSSPAPAGYSQVVTGPGDGTFRVGSDAPPTMTLNPAAMPAGTELSFGSFHLATGQQQADSALIDTSSYTCTSVPPDLDTTQSDQGGLLYGGPGPA